jgi:hypothetical protein
MKKLRTGHCAAVREGAGFHALAWLLLLRTLTARSREVSTHTYPDRTIRIRLVRIPVD